MENIYVWKDDEDTLTEKYFVNKLLKKLWSVITKIHI